MAAQRRVPLLHLENMQLSEVTESMAGSNAAVVRTCLPGLVLTPAQSLGLASPPLTLPRSSHGTQIIQHVNCQVIIIYRRVGVMCIHCVCYQGRA